MSVKDTIASSAAQARRWGLHKFRETTHAALARRDRGLSHLRELRNFDIPGPAGPLAARLYTPHSADAKSPLLLFFHGGGFVTGDLDTHDALCHRLAEAGRMRVLSCAYRLAPEAVFPAQLDDALAAARWVKRKCGWLGGDRRRLGVGGDSAGGYLALATAAKLRRTFKAQVLIYPLLHLEDQVWADSLARNTRVLGRLAVRYIETQLSNGDIRAPSLLEGERIAALPSVIAVGGALDPCAPDSAPLVERLKTKGAPVEFRAFPGQIHGFANLTHMSEAARKAVHDIGELAGQVLRT